MTNIRQALTLAVFLSMSACASDKPSQQTISITDPVAVTKARIEAEQRAGKEAVQVCKELGMESNKDCQMEIARSRLGVDANSPVGKFTNLGE